MPGLVLRHNPVDTPGARLHDLQVEAEAARRDPRLLAEPGVHRDIGICQHDDPGERRDGVLQDLEPLEGQLWRHARKSGDVTSRARQGLCKAVSDGVAHGDPDDWDRGRRLLDRFRRC